MRIRKYAQKHQICCIPPLILSPNNPCPRESPSTIVCELNRSPWDVISFTSKERREDNIGQEIADAVESILSLNGSNRVDDSILSPPMIESGEENRNEVKEINCSESRKEVMRWACCTKMDGKGWKCKKEAKQGHSLCKHHLEQLKSHYIKDKSSDPSSCISRLGKRSNSTNMKMSSSDYYYYTGFGPLWWKGREEIKSQRDIELDFGDSSSNSPSLLSSHNEDDGNDIENVGNKKKKRARKSVMI